MIDKLTRRSSEAFGAARQQATADGNPHVDALHLLAALVEQDGGTAAPLLRAVGADPGAVLADTRTQLAQLPKISGTTVMLVEQRPGFMNPAEWNSLNVAKFRYSPAKGQWSLYWSEGNDRWRRLSSAPASPDLAKLLQTVADDASGVFSK